MKVSVVVCTYTLDRYGPFCEAVDSVLAQSYEPLEVVLVVDGNDEVYERVRATYGDVDSTVIHNNDRNRGISYSRTKGAEIATGDIVAFIDDDAVAQPDWVENLVAVYNSTDALAVGGDVRPDWQTQKPVYFPDEFYWLVGVVEPGFASDGEEVRNTYGSNISYRRDVFLDVGGYDQKTGRKGDKHIQAHEAPVGIRLLEEHGQGMVFAEDAVVHHKLFEYRSEFHWLVFRSFWQGYSKRLLEKLYPDAPDDKRAYLGWLLGERIPSRLRSLITSPSVSNAAQLLSIFVFTTAVGLGYLYGIVDLAVETDTATGGEDKFNG